jgi:predicted O-methyltransferase YrrM
MNKDWLRVLLGDKPRFDIGVGAIGTPVRQFFMTGALHALKQRGVEAPRILEIGSWVGFSTFTWALTLEQFFGGQGTIVCIDPWEDYPFVNQVHGAAIPHAYRQMLTSGLTYELFMHNVSRLGTGVSVLPLRGRSDRILPLLRERSFDLIYIDGDHAFEAVFRDIQASVPLLKSGGILCGDDLELEYAQCDVAYATANRDAQPATDPKTGALFHPGVTLAVNELIGKVANYLGFWAVTSEARGFAPLSLDGESCFFPKHIDPQVSAALLDELRRRGIVK